MLGDNSEISLIPLCTALNIENCVWGKTMPLKSLIPLSKKHAGATWNARVQASDRRMYSISCYGSHTLGNKKEKNSKLPESREISYIQRVWRWPCLFAACVYLPALADMLTEGIGLGGKRSEPSDKQQRRFQNSNDPSRKWVLPNRSFPLWDRSPDSERNTALNVCVASFLWHAGGCDREKNLL